MFQHEGIHGFLLKHRGGISYLSEKERQQTLTWITAQESCMPVMLRTYLKETFGVSYQSPQSYDALLKEAGARLTAPHGWSQSLCRERVVVGVML